MPRLLRLFETVRHLRPEQILGRIWYRLARPAPDLRPAPPLRPAVSSWLPPALKPASLSGPIKARFLNVEAEIGEASIWQDTARHPLLWLYNLHYFDDLTAEGADTRRSWQRTLIGRWIDENPPVAGIGWQPYPTSLRIVNWIKGHLAGEDLSSSAIQSLAIQARHLRRRLEYHILGNHLLANAKALYFAGAFFGDAEGTAWAQLGRQLVEREMAEQVLPDGAHFELSPMYHQIVLEDLLDIINIGRALGVPLPTNIETVAGRMLGWSLAMRHPDGEIAFFNDAAFAITPAPAALDAYARALSIGPGPHPSPNQTLQASGYVALARGEAALLADAAAIGPNYLPGHAHADTLSFEFSLGTDRIVVNGGTSVYGTDAERQRQRGTSAHNTLSIDGENSSDVWAGFRVGRRARLLSRTLVETPSEAILSAEHDGYRHLAGSPRHHRTWTLEAQQLTVTDTVAGSGSHLIESYLHLHPSVSVSRADGGALLVSSASGKTIRLHLPDEADLAILDTNWHPRFGHQLPSVTLRLSRTATLPTSLQFALQWDD